MPNLNEGNIIISTVSPVTSICYISQMTQFYVMDVHFSLGDGTVSQQLCIIPDNWLSQNESEIFFPPYLGERINTAASNKEQPLESTWRRLNATYHGSFGIFSNILNNKFI